LTGNIVSSQITSVANTQISGNITAAQITSVANTQLTGLIEAAQIGSANATLITSGTLPKARLPTGSVLQVVQTVKTDFFSLGTTGTFTDVTGASVTITPTSASSKILVMFSGEYGGQSSDGFAYLRVLRDATGLSVGDARGSSRQVTMSAALRNGGANSPDISRSFGCQILDTPNTTSATTYKLQMIGSAGPSFCIGGSFSTSDANRASVPTFITAMEISA
jgi:hypothetical protein